MLQIVSDSIYNYNESIVEIHQISNLISTCDRMFHNCRNLKYLESASLPPNCTSCLEMFRGCTNLSTILSWGNRGENSLSNCSEMYVKTNIEELVDIKFPKIDNMRNMFSGTPLKIIKNVELILGKGNNYGIFDAPPLYVIDNLLLEADCTDTWICGFNSYADCTLIICNSTFYIKNRNNDEICSCLGTTILENVIFYINKSSTTNLLQFNFNKYTFYNNVNFIFLES